MPLPDDHPTQRSGSRLPGAQLDAPARFPGPILESLESRRLLSGSPLVAFGDVNADGISDFVLASPKAGDGATGPHLTVQLGNGDGTFAAPAAMPPVAAPARALAMGDLNGDGMADIVALSQSGGHPTVRAFLAGAGGSFTMADSSVSLAATTLLIGDVNGDGRADLVGVSKDAVGVALGNGDGTFAAAAAAARLGVDPGPAPALADVNGDGRADLVGFADGFARVAPGNANGAFGTPINVDVGLGGRKDARGRFAVAADDVNGNGTDDLVLLPTTGGRTVFVATGPGNGTFAPAVEGFVLSPSVQPGLVGPGFSTKAQYRLAVTHVNAGGGADLVGLERKPTTAAPLAFVALDNGKGFGQPILGTIVTSRLTGRSADTLTLGKSVVPSPVLAGDINGDGRADLVTFPAGRTPSVQVQLNQNHGVFATPTTFALNSATLPKGALVRLADFNGDGKDDLFVFDRPASGSTTLKSRVLMSTGDGTFAAAAERDIAGFPAGQIVTADLNGDGKADLLDITRPTTANPGSLIASITGGTSNTTAAAVAGGPFSATVAISSVGVGDVNGDKLPDLVGFGQPANGSVPFVVRLGDGSARNADGAIGFGPATTSTFTPPPGSTLAAGAQPLLADIDGDGRADAVVVDHAPQAASTSPSPVFVASARADGSFAPPVTAGTFFSPAGEAAIAGHIDNDVRTDLLSLSNAGPGGGPHLVTLTLVKGNGTFGKGV